MKEAENTIEQEAPKVAGNEIDDNTLKPLQEESTIIDIVKNPTLQTWKMKG